MNDTTSNHGPLRAAIEVLIVAGVYGGIYFYSDLALRGPAAIAASVAAITVLLRLRNESWTTLGLRLPRSISSILLGLALVIATYAAVAASVVLATPLIEEWFGVKAQAPLEIDTLSRYLTLMAIAWTTAAIGEEMLFRGFLLNRLAETLRSGPFGWALAVIAQSILFGVAHAYQGTYGVFITGIVAFVFGVAYLIGRRNLLPLIFAHGLIDTVSLTALYYGVGPAAAG